MLHLLLAIFSKRAPQYPSEFVRNVKALAYILLSLSNYLSLALGYGRLELAPSPGRGMQLPDPEVWDDLDTSIRFTVDELFGELPTAAVQYLVQELCTPIGELAGVDNDAIINSLLMKPVLIDTAGIAVIGAPRDLMTTLR